MKRISSFLLFILLVFSSGRSSAQTDTFKWLRDVAQQSPRNYSDALSAFCENGLWGFVSVDGKVAVSPVYEEVLDFENDLAIVRTGNKWGVIDKSGKLLHDCVYDSITRFCSGVALAADQAAKYYIYSDGHRKELPADYGFYPFSDGFARIRDLETGQWGYINPDGFLTVSIRYSEATDFNNGRAIVHEDGKAYVINKSGDRTRLPMEYTQDMTVFENGAGYISKSDGSLEFFTRGFKLTGREFLEIYSFSDGLAKVKDKSGRISYINKDGDVTLTLGKYDDAGDFSEGKTWVRKGEKFGYVNKSGRLVVDTLFTSVSDFSCQLAYVADGNRRGLIKIITTKDIFPELNISDIKLVDADADSIVEAEEEFSISFKVMNTGEETLHDAVVTAVFSPDLGDWFNHEDLKIAVGDLKPGEDKSLVLTGTATDHIDSAEMNVILKGEAYNLYRSPSFVFSFNTSNK